jgi:hypothetical protein
MAMVLQQQRADQQMRQRTQDQQYDMQRMGAMREMREPSIGEDDAMLEQEIRSGLYDPDTVRALRQDQRAMRQIMRDTNIDGTQRAQALGNLQSRMRMSRSTGKVQPMMQQMGPAALQTKPPMTEAEYFSDEKNYANAYAAAQARLEAAGPDTPVTPENIQAQMHNDYLAKQKFLQGLSQPQGQGQPAAQPPNAPATTPAANPQASYTGGQPTFGASPVMAQGGMGAPVGPGAYQPGSYTSPQVFGAANVLANPAQPPQQQPATQYLPGGAPYNANLVDMAYDAANPGRSAGTNYFDPENPEYARMRGADQSIVNPQKETLGKPGGRYGLGMIDYGINPATGNRVTASIRPGGTMPEYDEPVGKPGTAMGGGRGGLTIMGGRKKPAPAATADVSPGASTPAQMATYNALPEATAAPMRISRDDPKVKEAEAIAANPSATREQQAAAVATLDAAGFTEDDVAKLVAGRNSGQPTKKKLPAWGSQKDVLEIPGQIYGDISAQVKETQKRVGKVMQDRDTDNRQRAKSLMTGLPPSKDQEIADSLRESIETQRKNPRMKPASPPASPSLLGQLEQAEPPAASSVAPSPASDATQDQGKLRTWKNAEGKTLEGTLVVESLAAASRQPSGQQTITVKRKDGQFFNIPVSQLSEEDMAYLEAAFKVSRYLDGYDWTTGNTIKVGKGKASKYEKPTTEQKKYPSRSGPMSKSYRGEIPEEVLRKPPSSSRSVTGQIS